MQDVSEKIKNFEAASLPRDDPLPAAESAAASGGRKVSANDLFAASPMPRGLGNKFLKNQSQSFKMKAHGASDVVASSSSMMP